MEINLKSYLELLRIGEWRAYFFIAAFGFIVSKGFLFPLSNIILFWTLVFLFFGFGFSINECFDTKEDKYRKDKKPIVNRELSFKNSLIFSFLPGILGLALSAVFGLKVFLFCLAASLIGFFYSAPPLRLKSRALLDLVSHGLFAGAFIFILPLLIFNTPLNFLYYLITLSIFYLSIIFELRNHLEDYETDKKAGLSTTVCALGYKSSEKLLRYLAIFYPLVLFPIFLLISQSFLFLFLIFTLLFIPLFLLSRNYQLVKNYRILDIYAGFSFSLLLMATI